MHLLVRETRSLDEDAPARDLDQSPAPLVMLSFSDADLGALAAAWTQDRPPLRLASLATLRHPLSVDLYLEKTLAQARCVIIRLLGGLDYWRYGTEETAALCRAKGIPLALLPGDTQDDTRLRALSTIAEPAWAALNACFRAGGPANMGRVLTWAGHLAGLVPAPPGVAIPLPPHGVHSLDLNPGPLAAVVFYRSHLLSDDIAPITALTKAIRRRGLQVGAIYAVSLKSGETAAWIADTLAAWRPNVILNATAFSARPPDGSASPLDTAGVPVLQLVLSGSRREAWAASARGLSPTDLAMHVVLPEQDGRLLTTAISFKAETARDPQLQHSRTIHAPYLPGIDQAADRAAAWSRLAAAARPDRRVAIVLSDYPGIGGQQGHAVGLDTFASLSAILGLLAEAGYGTGEASPKVLTDLLCSGEPVPFLRLEDYTKLLKTLPDVVQESLLACWGPPDSGFSLRHVQLGNVTLALQPDRGSKTDRRTGYHDPDHPPCHAYVAFYLWLRHERDVHALIHLGTHGSLEWLPGKATALSAECLPQALLGALPVIYPFIVNNPGEAAPAKRRLGAVTIGHLTPPMTRSCHHGPAETLERLIEEYAAADGLDRRRTAALRTQILEQGRATNLLAEAGTPRDATEDEALSRLDAYLCDVKDLQIREGLHVYGRAPFLESEPEPDVTASAAAENAALLAALDARFIPPGPAGAPSRGRPDVFPTGRNLTTSDPRVIPTRSAFPLAERAASALLRRHLHEQGDYPKSIVLDLWASTTLRTGGEDLALAYVLLGARPVWDDNSSRVSGFEILPIALLDRPRIDVTLRISGLFRDAFPTQIALFDSLTQSLAVRDESLDWNPLASKPGSRVYGPPPGQYGAGDGSSWLQSSASPYGADPTAELAERLASTDAFIHIQDHAEQDLLDSPEWAAHEGGFAHSAQQVGASPTLYHLDTSVPDAPKPRTVAEEVRRVVRGRAANPAWIAGQMRHGYRGAAEIARPLAALELYAKTLPIRFDAQFDLLHDATLGNPAVDAFLRTENPAARADMAARFVAAQACGLWHPVRNLPPC